MSLANLSSLSSKDFKKVDLSIDSFKGGVNTLLSATRLKKNEAAEATNLLLSDDGVWTKRWGTQYYGGDAGGSVVDGFIEYRKSDGTRELIIFANDLVRKKSGSSWTIISGYTPTAGTPVQAIQIGKYLYACNGTDDLAYYDGTSFSTYTAITDPENLTATRNTLSAGDYDYYYTVTAHNDIGETIGATEVTEDVDEDRIAWSGDDAIDLAWDAVTNAVYYTVYFGTAPGFLEKLIDVTTNAFSDDGSLSPIGFILPPDDNTTVGPKFKYMCISQNRLWGVGDPDNPWKVYYTNLIFPDEDLVFSFAYGGGYVELEPGGKAITKGIIDFQGKPHVFCPTPEGRGNIFSINVSYNTAYSVDLPTTIKLTSQISSLAPRSIIQAENDVFFLTKRGVYLLGNEPNVVSDILRTNELSAKIRPYIRDMTNDDLEKTCAYYYDAKVFFSTPTRTFIYDREKLCWIKDWSVGFRQLGEYTDSNDVTHFIGGMSTDGYLVEIGENYKSDLGTAFSTSYLSPRFSMTKTWRDFAWMDKAFFRMGGAEGAINVEVLGTKSGGSFSSQVSGTIVPGLSNAGLGWDQLGSIQLGDSEGTPTTFSAGSLLRYLSIDKRLRDIQFKITTSAAASTYMLLGIEAEGRLTPTAPSLDWKLS